MPILWNWCAMTLGCALSMIIAPPFGLDVRIMLGATLGYWFGSTATMLIERSRLRVAIRKILDERRTPPEGGTPNIH